MRSKLLTIALDKVKTPAIKAHIVPEPFHPGSDVLAHPLLAVVQIGGCNIVLLGLVAASAPKGGVIVADVGLVPGQSPPKLVPLAIFLQHVRPTLRACSACLLHAYKNPVVMRCESALGQVMRGILDQHCAEPEAHSGCRQQAAAN